MHAVFTEQLYGLRFVPDELGEPALVDYRKSCPDPFLEAVVNRALAVDDSATHEAGLAE